MIARAVSVMITVLTLAGCAASSANSEAERIRPALAGLERQCGFAPGTLKLDRENLVTFQPASDAKFERVECVMRGLLKPELADHVKFGFVGNEAAAQEEEQ